MRAVETASSYFTRRARQERTKVFDAGSAEARKAHLELALRLVRVVTEPALWAWPEYSSGRDALAHDQKAVSLMEMGDALAGAFPLPPSGSFKHLLEAVDTGECP